MQIKKLRWACLLSIMLIQLPIYAMQRGRQIAALGVFAAGLYFVPRICMALEPDEFVDSTNAYLSKKPCVREYGLFAACPRETILYLISFYPWFGLSKRVVVTQAHPVVYGTVQGQERRFHTMLTAVGYDRVRTLASEGQPVRINLARRALTQLIESYEAHPEAETSE